MGGEEIGVDHYGLAGLQRSGFGGGEGEMDDGAGAANAYDEVVAFGFDAEDGAGGLEGRIVFERDCFRSGGSFPCEEIGGGARADDAAFFENDGGVGEAKDLGEVVANDDRGQMKALLNLQNIFL